MKIEILGPGCTRCQTLTRNVKTAVESLGLGSEIIKVTDMNAIASRGVLMTPALAIDGTVKTMGQIATVQEIRAFISAASGSKALCERNVDREGCTHE